MNKNKVFSLVSLVVIAVLLLLISCAATTNNTNNSLYAGEPKPVLISRSVSRATNGVYRVVDCAAGIVIYTNSSNGIDVVKINETLLSDCK